MKKGQIGMMIVIGILITALIVTVVLIRNSRATNVEAQCHYVLNGPDPNCTPGDGGKLDLKIVCAQDYPENARDVSTATKKKVYAMYGIKNPKTGDYQIDHLISLGLGGSNEVINLWPQPLTPYPGYKEKDNAERKLHELVCNNRIPLASAQYMISHNWQSNTGLYQ
jgi:hypothetical protein